MKKVKFLAWRSVIRTNLLALFAYACYSGEVVGSHPDGKRPKVTGKITMNRIANTYSTTDYEKCIIEKGQSLARYLMLTHPMNDTEFRVTPQTAQFSIYNASLAYPVNEMYSTAPLIHSENIRDVRELRERMRRAFFYEEFHHLMMSMKSPFGYFHNQPIVADINPITYSMWESVSVSYAEFRSRVGLSALYRDESPRDDKYGTFFYEQYLGVNRVTMYNEKNMEGMVRKALKQGKATFVIETSTWRRYDRINPLTGRAEIDDKLMLFTNNEPVIWDFYFEGRNHI